MLDPQVAAFYGDRLNTVPTEYPSVEQMRQSADETFHDKIHRVPIQQSIDEEIATEGGSIPLRIYLPCEDTKCRPLLLYFHGGGFIMHNIQSHDDLCRRLAQLCDCVVVSVGYRLAPEAPWPACMQDGYAALLWAAENAARFGADPHQISVGGDSAGASISAVLCLMARDRKGPKIHRALLCYGSFGAVADEDSASVAAFGCGGYVLPKKMMDHCMSFYLPQEKSLQNDPYLFPAKATDLSALPQTFVITAACDPLRDDGEAYAAMLRSAGNDVTLLRAEGLMHGFLLYWYRFDAAQKVLLQIRDFLQR